MHNSVSTYANNGRKGSLNNYKSNNNITKYMVWSGFNEEIGMKDKDSEIRYGNLGRYGY